MKNSRVIVFCVVALCAGAAHTHHSIVTHYDPNGSIRLTGVVAQYDQRSPHSFLFLDVTGEDDRIERWEVELVSLAHLRRAGIDEETFQRGKEVTIIALPNRLPTNPLVFGVNLVTEGGMLALGSPGNNYVDPAAGAQRLEGRWLTPFPEQAGESPLLLNEAGQQARESYDPQTSPANSCEPISMPSLLATPYMTDIQIGEEQVIFRHEYYGVVRTVPLNADPAPAEPTGFFGMVRGRLEADSLVIESNDYPTSAWGLAAAVDRNGRGADVPSSAQKRVVERYTLGDGGRTLVVNYTVEDPMYLREPYSGQLELTRVADDAPMYDYVCETESANRFSRDP